MSKVAKIATCVTIALVSMFIVGIMQETKSRGWFIVYPIAIASIMYVWGKREKESSQTIIKAKASLKRYLPDREVLSELAIGLVIVILIGAFVIIKMDKKYALEQKKAAEEIRVAEQRRTQEEARRAEEARRLEETRRLEDARILEEAIRIKEAKILEIETKRNDEHKKLLAQSKKTMISTLDREVIGWRNMLSGIDSEFNRWLKKRRIKGRTRYNYHTVEELVYGYVVLFQEPTQQSTRAEDVASFLQGFGPEPVVALLKLYNQDKQ